MEGKMARRYKEKIRHLSLLTFAKGNSSLLIPAVMGEYTAFKFKIFKLQKQREASLYFSLSDFDVVLNIL
jgi:hypothetical protein